MFCSVCDDETEKESEIHLLRCSSTVTEVGHLGDLKYEDVFSHDVNKQARIAEIFSKILRKRKSLMKKEN